MDKIFKIKIALIDIEPTIWRRILISSNTKLEDFHKIIQTTMGWTNSHLHQFVHDNKFYCNRDFEDDWDTERQVDYSKITIEMLLKNINDSIIYEYDFGDGWEHLLLLEDIISDSKRKNLPICLDGARNCPPEDCGGIDGYENILQIISNPKHEEYEEMIEWLGGSYNANEFKVEEVNECLKEDEYGCITLSD